MRDAMTDVRSQVRHNDDCHRSPECQSHRVPEFSKISPRRCVSPGQSRQLLQDTARYRRNQPMEASEVDCPPWARAVDDNTVSSVAIEKVIER